MSSGVKSATVGVFCFARVRVLPAIYLLGAPTLCHQIRYGLAQILVSDGAMAAACRKCIVGEDKHPLRNQMTRQMGFTFEVRPAQPFQH